MDNTPFKLFLTFARMGSVSFGGYMALISVIQQSLVNDKKLFPSQVMTDLVALATLLPGPVAVNVVTAIGFHLRGWVGALASFLGVLTPAFCFMLLLYSFYEQWVNLEIFKPVFLWIICGIVAVILWAGYSMIQKVGWKNRLVGIIPATMVFLFFYNSYFSMMLLFLITGLVGWLTKGKQEGKSGNIGFIVWTLPVLIIISGIFYSLPSTTNIYFDIASTFSTISLSLFGGGYVMIPLLNDLIVVEKQWLSNREFFDAIALGQVTPGPILISAAFVGFKVAGFWGGVIATLAIFGPSSILMVAVSANLKLWIQNEHVRSFFDGLRMTVIGMILYSGITLYLSLEFNLVTSIFVLVALGLLIFYRISTIYLVFGSALIGVIFYWLDFTR